MAKEEWGTKRVCPETGKRFYDLNANPVISPYTGKVVELDNGKSSRTMVADKADAGQKTKAEIEDELLDADDAADAADVQPRKGRLVLFGGAVL